MEQVCVRLVFLCWKGEREGKRWNDVGFDMPERDIVAYRKSAEAVHVVVIILRLSPSVQGFLLPALTTLLTQSFWSLYRRSLALRTVKSLTRAIKDRNTRRTSEKTICSSLYRVAFLLLSFAIAKFYVWNCLRKRAQFCHLITGIDRKFFADCQESACCTPRSTTQEKCRWVRRIALIMHGNSGTIGMLLHECRK